MKCKECGNRGYGYHDCFNETLWSGDFESADRSRRLEKLYLGQVRARGEAEVELDGYKRKFDQLCAIFHLAMEAGS